MVTTVNKSHRPSELMLGAILLVTGVMGSLAKPASAQTRNDAVRQQETIFETDPSPGDRAEALINLGKLAQQGDKTVLPYLLENFPKELAKDYDPERFDITDTYVKVLVIAAPQDPQAVEKVLKAASDNLFRQLKASQTKPVIIVNGKAYGHGSTTVAEAAIKSRIDAIDHGTNAAHKLALAGPTAKLVAPAAPASGLQAPSTAKPNAGVRADKTPAPAIATAPRATPPQAKPNDQAGKILQSDGTYASPEELEQRGMAALTDENTAQPLSATAEVQTAPHGDASIGILSKNALLNQLVNDTDPGARGRAAEALAHMIPPAKLLPLLKNRLNYEVGFGNETSTQSMVNALIFIGRLPGGSQASEILGEELGREYALFRNIQTSQAYQAKDSQALATASRYAKLAAILEKGFVSIPFDCESLGIIEKFQHDGKVYPGDPVSPAFRRDMQNVRAKLGPAAQDPECAVPPHSDSQPHQNLATMGQLQSIVLNDENPVRRAAAAAAIGQRGDGSQGTLTFLAHALSNEIDIGAPIVGNIDAFKSIVTALHDQGGKAGPGDPGGMVGSALLDSYRKVYEKLEQIPGATTVISHEGPGAHWQNRHLVLVQAINQTPVTCELVAEIERFKYQTAKDGPTPGRNFLANVERRPIVAGAGCRY